MKYFLLFSVCFILCVNIAEAQTNAGIPDASTVLVVYREPVDENDSLGLMSLAIKNYYQNARGIPESNIVPLQLPRREISVGDWSDPHVVKLGYSDEYIQDSTWAVWDSTHCIDTAKFHAWQYFLEEVANPIRLHLQQNNLTSTIRYILICRGVPYKIQAAGDFSIPGNINIDGLLCMLNTYNYDDFAGAIFNNYTSQCYYNSCDPNTPCYGYGFIKNPYFDKDPTFEMNARFLPDYYDSSWSVWDYKLSYLVSRLDGLSYDIITDIIDKSVASDKSGEKTWIIDGGGPGSGDMLEAFNRLNALGFTTEYNDDIEDWITTSLDSVMGYTSAGVHQGMLPTYIQDTLDFDYARGSVFNTYESFNGFSIGTIRRAGQGLMTEFTLTGGTGGAGHSWEPYTSGVIADYVYFPYYAIGYNQTDAAWQGMFYLAWRNVIVGDPLTRIFDCENTVISTNTTIGSGEYECDVTVPPNITLTIASGSVVNFKRISSLKVYGTLVIEDEVVLNFYDYSDLNLTDGNNISFGTETQLIFNDRSVYLIDSGFEITTNHDFVFNDESEFQVNGTLNMDVNSSITFNDGAELIVYDGINLSQGTAMNFNNTSRMRVYGSLICLGDNSNKVIFNLSGSTGSQVHIIDGINFEIDKTIFNNNGIAISLSSDQINPEYLSITNSTFNDPGYTAIALSFSGASFQTAPVISNCTFNNCIRDAVSISQAEEITIENNTMSLEAGAKGIILEYNGVVNIVDCIITNGAVGVESAPSIDINTGNLSADISITQCTFEDLGTGVLIDYQLIPYEAVNINYSHFESCDNAILVNKFFDYAPVITGNIISGLTDGDSEIGILLTNGDEAIVSNNSITNFLTGISLTMVNNPHIIENFITGVDLTIEPFSGIFAVSSNGEIRLNTIQYHKIGLELGGSSPMAAENVITGNLQYGLYASSDSHPDLGLTSIGLLEYPLTGYNSIYENGVCDLFPNPEIFLNKSTIDLESGCNTIADDREDIPLQCDFFYLMDAEGVEREINAVKNYWGNHPVYGNNPEGRFGGGLSVDYSGFLDAPCTYSQGEGMLLLTTSDGEVYDTVYSSGSAPSELTDLQSRFASANEYYYNHLYTEAKQEYSGVIENYGNSRSSLKAYNKLLRIEKQLNSPPETFQSLKTFYLQKVSGQTDSIIISTLTHLSNLCLVSAKEYETAINNFDQIVQQNPNSDVALYREIDALATVLLLSSDSTLGKQAAGKYYVSGMDDYNSKVRDLLKNRRSSKAENDEETIPTEYTLYQNYPNPFNPTTTIKYDLPKSGNVELMIYDILGRKVKTLINETKEAGRYEVKWDASSVASGVYIYQLRTENFVNTKKMILLR